MIGLSRPPSRGYPVQGGLEIRELRITMHRKALTIAVCALLALTAREASAQSLQNWTDRGYFNFNAGFESTSGTLNDATTFRLYDEDGTKTVEHGVDSGAFIDFSVGGRVWRNVSVGIGFHREATTSQAAVTASVPNPQVFNRNRSVAVVADDLGRTERAVHLSVGYMIPLNNNLSVHVYAGPSFFRLSQDVVSDVTFVEQPPAFTSVSATAVFSEQKKSVTGAHFGGDVSYILYENASVKLGGGAFLRWAGATAGVPILGTTEIESDLGGLQIGFGARVRF